MKICPFISHLLGEGHSNTLAIGARAAEGYEPASPGDVVILGYDSDEGASSVHTEVMTETGTRTETSNQLHCLRESCRFFQRASAECQFDVMYMRLKALESSGDGGNAREITRDIDKIWKFQTKGVAEIVESLADSEKKQAESVEALKRELTRKMDELAGTVGTSSVQSVQDEMQSLKKNFESREESFESLSTTVSDFVASLEESFKEFKSFSSGLKDKLDGSLESRRDIDRKLSSWKDDIAEKLLTVASRQEAWEKRLEDLIEQQKELAGYLQAGEKHREEEQARQAKKESKKYNNLGVTSFHNGAYEMARDQFLQAVKLDPDFAEAYNNLGLTHTELSEEEKATEAFKRAVELNPSLHAAYNNLGYVLYKQGNYEQAVEMYNEALGRSTKNGLAYTNLGNACFKLGQIDRAREAWTKALELDPGNEKARMNLQRINENNG
jgi:tetratricopeptide (TPR) repeat protein